MYTFFVILHILSAACFVGLGVAVPVLNKLRKGAAGTMGEIYYMRTIWMQTRVLGNAGAIGVIITGAAAAGIAHYPWFAFNALPWLALKQTIYVLILIITGAMLIPASLRMRTLIATELTMPSSASGASAGLKRAVGRLVSIVYLIEFFVVINIILGESQAMLWLAK